MPVAAFAPGTNGVGTESHPLNVEINGSDFVRGPDTPSTAPYVLLEGLTVEQAGPGPTHGSCSFSIYDSASALTVNDYDIVKVIEHAATTPTQFGGFVQSVRLVAIPGQAGRRIDIDAMGFGTLLDRKIVPLNTIERGTSGIGANSNEVISLVNQYGGIVSASGFNVASTAFNSDAAAHVAIIEDANRAWIGGPGDSIIVSEVSLLNGVEAILNISRDEDLTTITAVGVGYVYWVDGDARLHATWDPPDGPDSAFEGAATALTESSIIGGSYEGDASPIATSVYVKGSTAGGSGFYRGAAKPVAGDIETIVTTDTTTAGGVTVTGRGAVERLGSTVGQVTIESSTPLNYRPGMRVAITSSKLGLSADVFRITGVTIRFDTLSHRTYTLSFGGRRPLPTAMRELVGRIAAA